MVRRIRVGIIDADCFSLLGLSKYIEFAVAECEIVWKSRSSLSAFRNCVKCCPDVVLIDLRLREISGLCVIHELRRRYKNLVIAALTSDSIEKHASRVAKAGGQIVISKDNFKRLANFLTAVARGTFHAAPIGDVIFEDTYHAFCKAQHKPDKGYLALSERENEIIRLCSLGLTTSEISFQLSIGNGTVETLIRRAYHKMRVNNRLQLVTAWLCDRYCVESNTTQFCK